MPRHISATLACAAVLAAGCGGDDPAGAGGERRPTVFAAASLAQVLPALDPDARYSFAGSNELATQIREGAPADVYAAANAKYPGQLFAEGLVEQPVTFASNRLVLVVRAGAAHGMEAVEDVTRPGTKLVIAAAGVPAGDYTRELLDALHLRDALANVVSNEDDVKGVVAKVALGEADAGFVYATDAAAADGVTTVELPSDVQPPIEYQVAVVARSRNREAAEAFVRRLLGPAGRSALEAAGFRVP